jgi:signal transduction histidine kinase
MTASLRGDSAEPGTALSTEADDKLRRQQLLIVEKTSWPGVAFGGSGALLVFAWGLFGAESSGTRNGYLAISTCLFLMVGLWVIALWRCRRDDLRGGFLAQFVANLVCTSLFFLFIERGAVLALLTAFTGLSSGAMILDERSLRTAGLAMTVVVLVSATAHELHLVEPIAIPEFLLYAATTIGIVFTFRTPMVALRMFKEHVQGSRAAALRLARQAAEERDRADRHARDLEEVGEELREFTYVVSHDLRAPLINIEGFSQALNDSLREFDEKTKATATDGAASSIQQAWLQTRAEVVESLHFISRSAEKLKALITGLLELSRIDSRPQQEQSVALTPLLDGLLGSMQHQIRERGIAVHVAPLPTIVGDQLRISQVFGNLIDNAIKYMPDRAPREVSVSCKESGDFFVFAVTDTGNGIPPDSRQRVFRPFRRLDAKDSPAGEGLGLAAVRKIIERQGGRIWVEEPPNGRGACFRFTWPRRQSRPAPSSASVQTAA